MANRSSFKLGWIIILLLVAGGGYAAWKWQKPASSSFQYKTTVVARGDVVQSVTANGQLTPVVTVQVGSQVSGNILKLFADFNSKVTNGQLVAELDAATYESRRIQAEADLANATAQAKLAGLNAKRADELVKNQLLAQSEFDQSVADLAQKEATVKMREAALTNAQVDVARTKIYSPIDGTVISRNVDIGQTVQASFTAPTLFNIANDLAKMEIAAMVSEADIGGVADGQEASFTVEAFPNRTFRGLVKQVRNQPTTNQNVVTYAAMIDVRNADLKLKPGMTATIAITTSRTNNVLRIPNSVLRFRPPEGANVSTNLIRLASAGPVAAPQAVAAGSASAEVDDGIPDMPDGTKMPPDRRKRILERYDKNGDGKLDAAELKEWQDAMRARMAAGGGGGPGGGGFGGGGGGGGFGGGSSSRGSSEPAQAIRTVYLVSTNAPSLGGKSEIVLQPVQIKTGISDGTVTEVLEGLKEKDVIAIGTIGATTASAAGAQPNNPFGGPFGGGRPR
jgi:HlyD family secretion protein